MNTKWFESLTGSLEQKKQYRRFIARLDALSNDYAELWERAAADSTPIRNIVGEDPVEFANDFISAYSGSSWSAKEQARLRATIARTADSQETQR